MSLVCMLGILCTSVVPDFFNDGTYGTNLKLAEYLEVLAPSDKYKIELQKGDIRIVNSPIFGNDIRIVNNANTTMDSWSNLGCAYSHPQYAQGTNEAKSFLAGSYNCQLDEIEVYQKEE